MDLKKWFVGLFGFLYVDHKLTQQVNATRAVEATIRQSTERQVRATQVLEEAIRSSAPHESTAPEPKGEFAVEGKHVLVLFSNQGEKWYGSGDDLVMDRGWAFALDCVAKQCPSPPNNVGQRHRVAALSNAKVSPASPHDANHCRKTHAAIFSTSQRVTLNLPKGPLRSGRKSPRPILAPA